MRVTFIADEYRCGSKLGLYAEDYEGLIKDLTDAIDFEGSDYPTKWTETEDKKAYHPEKQTPEEYFGDQEKIKPGRMFVYDGQVFAVDSDTRLVLTLSETGALAVRRFLNEVLKPELELIRGEIKISDVKIEEIKEIPEDLKENKYSIHYYIGKVWKDRVGDLVPKTFKTVFKSQDSFTDIELYVSGFNVYFNPDVVFEDQVGDLVQDFLTWTYKNYKDDRHKQIDKGVDESSEQSGAGDIQTSEGKDIGVQNCEKCQGV